MIPEKRTAIPIARDDTASVIALLEAAWALNLRYLELALEPSAARFAEIEEVVLAWASLKESGAAQLLDAEDPTCAQHLVTVGPREHRVSISIAIPREIVLLRRRPVDLRSVS